MNHTIWGRRGLPSGVEGTALGVSANCFAQAQGGRGGQALTAPKSGRASAPAEVDLTGYWVSLVTEDWRWRMVTPAKGDYASVPITLDAKRVADAWDPDKDEKAGEACRSYGAAGIMRVPARVHVTWQDENTLKV